MKVKKESQRSSTKLMTLKSTSQGPKQIVGTPKMLSAKQGTATGAGARPMYHGTASTLGATPVVKGKYPITSSMPKNQQKLRG